MGRLVTVGVYGFSAEWFLAALEGAAVDVLLDVRQRRGARGSEYAWANSRRLQQALTESGIAYRHLKELAPTSEIRAAQYAADATAGEGKRTRTELSDGFKRAYVEQILAPANLGGLTADFDDSVTGALLCVERDPRACHRSLIADRLVADFGVCGSVPCGQRRPRTGCWLSPRVCMWSGCWDRPSVAMARCAVRFTRTAPRVCTCMRIRGAAGIAFRAGRAARSMTSLRCCSGRGTRGEEFIELRRELVVVRLAETARKHGVADEDALHAVRNAIAQWRLDDDFTMRVGPARDGNLWRSACSASIPMTR